jgi:hypothetical protein
MKILIPMVLVIAMASGPGYGQSVSGKVLDLQGNAMPFVNILLLNTDSTLVKGAATTENGDYTITNVRDGRYVLAASMVGYKMTYSEPVVVEGQPFKAPVLVLETESTQLKEVSVVATRPFIEQAIDKTIINVSNSIVSGGGTALEVLEKSPGVIVDRQNDGISLGGKDGVIVMIDGKPTYLAMADIVAMLRTMPSDNIDKIELVTNPSSRYDAAGNSGIINIVLKKNNNFGTNGSLSVAAGSGRYDRERASMQINHRSKKFNLFTNVSGSRGGNYWDFTLHRKQRAGDDGWNYVDQNAYINYRHQGQNGKIGIDYFLTKKTTLGIVVTGFWNDNGEKSPAYSSMRAGEFAPPYLSVVTDKRMNNEISNRIGNANLQHNFSGKGGTLSADIDVGRFTRDFTNTLVTSTLHSEEPVEGDEGIFTTMPVTIDIITWKSDYSRTVGEKWKIDAGIKGSTVKSDNNMQLLDGYIGQLQLNTDLSNHFRYTEQIFALYGNIAGKINGTIDVQLGLRAEQTHSIGKSLTLDQRVERNYLNLFPSLFLSRNLGEKHKATVSYSYRIDRPNYQNLNPARSYLDPYAFQRGNPFLQPQYTHSLELKHGFDNKIFTTIGMSHVTDFVFFLIQPVDDQTAERTPENIGTVRSYNINLSFPVTFSKAWSFQGNVMGIYSTMEYLYMESFLTLEQTNARINGSNTFVLGKGWTAELSGWINTPTRTAIFISPWIGTVDAGLQKSIRSNLKARLTVQDAFKTNRWALRGGATGFEQDVSIRFDSRVAMLNLTYNFGNQQIKSIRQRKTASEEEMQRTY